jgi:primosomal protein N''
MDNERLLEILMHNVQMLTDKISFYTEQGISQRKIDLLETKKDRYQQAIIDLE